MTCKDCIQYDFCARCGFAAEDETATNCKNFKDKTNWNEFICSNCGFPNSHEDYYCPTCGARMGGDVDLEESSSKEKLCFAVGFFKSDVDVCFIQYPTTDEAMMAYTKMAVDSPSYGSLTVFCFAENRDEAIKIASEVKEDFLARKDKYDDPNALTAARE